jgi:hypothetical protein
MFHTYVLAASGTVVDFDRASFLMDRELLQQSLDAMRDERDRRPRSDATHDAQWVWDDYCQRHREQYGEGFVCDVTPGWDQQPEKPDEPSSEGESSQA